MQSSQSSKGFVRILIWKGSLVWLVSRFFLRGFVLVRICRFFNTLKVALELAYSVFFQLPELFQAHTNGHWPIGCFTKASFFGIHSAQSWFLVLGPIESNVRMRFSKICFLLLELDPCQSLKSIHSAFMHMVHTYESDFFKWVKCHSNFDQMFPLPYL